MGAPIWPAPTKVTRTGYSAGRPVAMVLISVYCSKPSMPFWRPTPLAL